MMIIYIHCMFYFSNTTFNYKFKSNLSQYITIYISIINIIKGQGNELYFRFPSPYSVCVFHFRCMLSRKKATFILESLVYVTPFRKVIHQKTKYKYIVI